MCYMLFDDVGETEHCVCFASLSAIIGTKRMCSVCGHFTQSLAQSVTQSLGHSATQSLGHSATQSLGHSVTASMTSQSSTFLSPLVEPSQHVTALPELRFFLR